MNHNLVVQRAIFLSAAAYQVMRRNRNRSDFVIPQGYPLIATLGSEEDPLFGCVLKSNKRVIIAFRGSENSSELIRGLDMVQGSFPYGSDNGKTHRGFTTFYSDSIRSRLMRTLRKISPSGVSLWITGHSLGGAIATLCALDTALHSSFKQPVLYTFGSPKVGDATFTSAFDRTIQQSVRVVNTLDIVPQLPPSTEGYIYQHVKGYYGIDIQRSNVFSNHHILQYHRKLAELDNAYSESMCKKSPGYCPAQGEG